MTNQSREAIQQAMLDAENAPTATQPAILMHRDIDHTNVGEYTSTHVNEEWAAEIKKLIDDGWIAFRIQTEYGIYSHSTIAYFAKMKSN